MRARNGHVDDVSIQSVLKMCWRSGTCRLGINKTWTRPLSNQKNTILLRSLFAVLFVFVAVGRQRPRSYNLYSRLVNPRDAAKGSEMLKVVFISLACLALLQTVCLADLFNYGMDYERENGSDSWGQPDWDEVECNNIEDCVSSLCLNYCDLLTITHTRARTTTNKPDGLPQQLSTRIRVFH